MLSIYKLVLDSFLVSFLGIGFSSTSSSTMNLIPELFSLTLVFSILVSSCLMDFSLFFSLDLLDCFLLSLFLPFDLVLFLLFLFFLETFLLDLLTLSFLFLLESFLLSDLSLSLSFLFLLESFLLSDLSLSLSFLTFLELSLNLFKLL